MGWLSKGLGFVGGAVGSLFGAGGSAIGSSIGSGLGDFISGSGSSDGFGLSDVVNLGSSALGLYNGLTGNQKSIEQQMAYDIFRSNLATEQWKTQYGQRHQLEVEDLRNAGLNPLLSANSAGSVSGANFGTIPETQSDRVRNALQGAQNLLNLKIGNSAIQTNLTQQDLNRATASMQDKNGTASLMNAYSNLLKARSSSALDYQLAKNAKDFPANQSFLGKEVNSALGLFDRLSEVIPRKIANMPSFKGKGPKNWVTTPFNPGYGTGD